MANCRIEIIMKSAEITKVDLNTIFSKPRLVKETFPPPNARLIPVPRPCMSINKTKPKASTL